LLGELVDAPQTFPADFLARRIEGDTVEPAYGVDAVPISLEQKKNINQAGLKRV
jgi:hypothetical protein